MVICFLHANVHFACEMTNLLLWYIQLVMYFLALLHSFELPSLVNQPNIDEFLFLLDQLHVFLKWCHSAIRYFIILLYNIATYPPVLLYCIIYIREYCQKQPVVHVHVVFAQ